MSLVFTKQMQGQLCDPGENARFSCATDAGLPSLSATWLKDNKPLDDKLADRVKVMARENHFTLELLNCMAQDSGQYTCRVSGPAGKTVTCSAHLEVHKLTPEERKEREESNQPDFMVKLRDSEFLLESTASFMIHVKGNPNPDVKFFKNGQALAEDSRITINRDYAPHGSYEITIHKVQQGDAGSYSAVAANTAGKAESTCEVSVKDAKDVFALLKGHERIVPAGEEPTFTWFKAGQEFDPEDRFKVLFKDEEDTLALVFQHINPEDAGLYTCVASTSTGKISCSAELSVEGSVQQLLKEPEPPQILLAMGDVDASLGGSAMLELKMKGYPRPNIKWMKDGKVVVPGDRFKFVHPDPETIALIISKVEAADEGKYEVVLVNDLGEAKTEGKLTISGAPQFKEPIENQTMAVDDTWKIVAKVTGNPQLTWYKDGVPITESSRVKCVQIDPETFELTFAKTSLDDNGNWAVIARNPHGEMSQFFTFSAQMIPRFEVKLEDVEANEGQQVILKCKIACTPAPAVAWFKEGTDITKDPRVKCYKDPNGYDCLQINSVSRNMAGGFEIKATNDMGQAESKCKLKVNTKPVCDDLDDAEAVEADDFTFAIQCDGDPKPVCKWTKDGVALADTPDGHITISENSGIYKLAIKGVKMDDKGKYGAEFTNRAGEKKVAANLNVLSQEDLKTPKCLEDLKDKTANKGAKTFFQLKIRGDPTPVVKWYLNGKEIVEGPHFKMSCKDFVYRLDLIDVSEEMAGKIKVVATNENGQDQREANFDVLFQPEFMDMETVKVGPGEIAKMICRVKASPDPDVVWMKLNEQGKAEPIDCKADPKWERASLSMEKNGPWEIHTLTIRDVDPSDAGHYQVQASNRLGKSEMPCDLVVVTEPPRFPQPLKDVQQSRLGANEVFVAVVSGVPKPQVCWMKGQTELKKGKRLNFEEEALDDGAVRYKMTVKDVEDKDFGQITLHAKNMVGEADSVCKFEILPVKPTIECNFPKIQEIKEGGEFVLTAKVDGSPPPTAIWLFDGEPVQADGKRIIITEEDSPDGKGIITTLRVKPCAAEDQGKYTLLVKNAAGEARAESVLDVVGKPKAPKVVKEISPKELTVPGKSEIRLQCKITGFPAPKIKWLRDGNEIKVRKGVLVEQDASGNATLVIEKAQVSDAGVYTAVGVNDAGSAETSCVVHVTQPTEEPKFTSLLRSAKAVEGSPVKLEGKMTGHPMPQLRWLKDGQEFVPDGKRVRQFLNDDGSFGLIFETTTVDDKGAYTAVAFNSEGEAKSTGNVAIKPRMKEGVDKMMPSFVRPLGDVSVDEGQKLRITTPVKGNPVPTFSWTKEGGQPIDPNRVHFFSDGELIGMEISQAVMSDAGKYECHLTNEVGTTTGVCNVTVHKIFKPPVFTRHLVDTKQLLNCDARLVCEVGANPKPDITWLFNGKPITEDHKGGKYQIKNNGNTRMLIIRKLEDLDAGEYKCVAKNQEGQAESKAHLEIVEMVERKRSDAPEFLKTIGDELVFRGMSAKFTALVTGTPEPEFEFTFNGQPLEPSDRIHIFRDRNGLIRLSLAYVEETDIGVYGLRAWNEHGEAFCQAQLLYDGLEVQPDQSLGDCYQGFDRFSISGLPIALPDKPLVTQMSDTHVTLTWKPALALGPNLAPYYMVEVCEYPDGEWKEVWAEVRGISCDINGLTPLRDYKFRVSVRNRFGLSDPSPYCVAHRSLLVPQELQVVSLDDTKFDLAKSKKFPKGFDIYKEPYEGFTHRPRFLLQEESTQFAVKNSSAEVAWNLYGFPMPEVSFLFEGKEVEIGDKYQFSYSRAGVVSLAVKGFGAADVGTYECIARNEHGEARQSVVMEMARHPEFIREPTDVHLIGVNGGKIECQVFGVPKPRVQWFKDYHPLKETSRVQAFHYPPDVHTVFFEDYITRDEGLYTVTASNICGSISYSVMVRIMEDEREYDWMTYRRTKPIIPRTKGFDKFYFQSEEIGRGTQGVTSFVQAIMPVESDASGHHVVEEADSKYWWLHRGVKEHAPTIDPAMIPYRFTGGNFAAKNMKSTQFKSHMMNEFEMMNLLHHPKLIRLVDAYDARDEMTLITEMATGGELLETVTAEKYITEIEIARIVQQLLEGLEYMHSKGIGHLGLTPCDVLFSRPGGTDIKICDFSLARRIVGNVKLDFGQPEFVAPEIVNMEGAGFGSDMWSVGIITYLLVSGVSPFRGQNDRETLQRIQMGDIDFDYELWSNISREAKHFVANLLVYKPEERMSVRQALAHPWLQILKQPGIEIGEQYQISTERLRNYYGGLKEWYANAACDDHFRRRPLSGAFTHPSCMVYPPGEPDPVREVTPKPKIEIDEWRRMSYTIEPFQNPSNYQNGPDTYLMQVKGPDFPARLREYLSVARISSHEFRAVRCPIVKERRRFVDVMEEETELRREARLDAWGRDDFSVFKPSKIMQQLGGDDVDREVEITIEREVIDGTQPFFREKPRDIALCEGRRLELTCLVSGDPRPAIHWLKNDLIVLDDARMKVETVALGGGSTDHRCTLTMDPAVPSDAGLYRAVARSPLGQSTASARVALGDVPDSPDSPLVEAMTDTDVLLAWRTPSRLNHAPVLCYRVQMGYIDTDIDWVDLADDIKHEYFVVDSLRPSQGYKFRVCAMNKFGWSIPSIPSAVAMTPSTGASKAEFYDVLQMLQAREDINLDAEDSQLSYECERKPIKMLSQAPGEVDFMAELWRGRFWLTANINHAGKICTAKIFDKSDPEAEDAAKREFKNLKGLRHERMATLTEAYETSKMYLLKFDTLPGTDVLTYLSEQSSTYSEQTVAEIAAQILDGLAYLHWRGKVYLNLEPGNVIVCSGRSLGKTLQVKLANFETTQTVAKEGTQIKGSYNFDYAAPEILSEAKAFPQSDVWSLGVLLYVLLSGELPFKGEAAEETKDNILRVRYKFEWLYKETSMEASRLLMWIFKRAPWKRPQLEEAQNHRWLSPVDYMLKKRERARFSTNRIQKFARDYHRSRPQMDLDGASFFSKVLQ